MTEKQFNSLKPPLFCGVLAAASAALLWLSLLRAPFLPFLFGIGVSLPVFYALFCGGFLSGLIAAVLAAILLYLALPAASGLLLAVFFFPPALLTGWLLNLRSGAAAMPNIAAGQNAATARPAEAAPAGNPAPAAANGFYPLSAAIFQLALAVAFVTIAVLLFVFSQPESIAAFEAAAAQIIQLMQDSKLYDISAAGPEAIAALRRLLPVLFAMSLALYGLLFQLAALYGALRLAARARRLRRPLPCWPAELRMPPLAAVIFILLWLGSYFIDNPQSTLAFCVNIIVTALTVGFFAAGLAALHQVARGPWLWLRIVIYVCLFSLALTPIIVLGLVIMGLFATPFPAFGRNGRPSA